MTSLSAHLVRRPLLRSAVLLLVLGAGLSALLVVPAVADRGPASSLPRLAFARSALPYLEGGGSRVVSTQRQVRLPRSCTRELRTVARVRGKVATYRLDNGETPLQQGLDDARPTMLDHASARQARRTMAVVRDYVQECSGPRDRASMIRTASYPLVQVAPGQISFRVRTRGLRSIQLWFRHGSRVFRSEVLADRVGPPQRIALDFARELERTIR